MVRVVLSCTGLVGTKIIQGSADTASFFDFLSTEVVPQLPPFPGPYSILVLDNWSGHLEAECIDLVKAAGSIFMPLLLILSRP